LLRRNPAVRAKHFLRHIKPLKASAYKGGQELLTAASVDIYYIDSSKDSKLYIVAIYKIGERNRIKYTIN
jgi:hypothetical protein